MDKLLPTKMKRKEQLTAANMVYSKLADSDLGKFCTFNQRNL